MEIVKKDTVKGKRVSNFNLYKEFIMAVIKKNISKGIAVGIEVSNNFFGGIEQRFENRKFECLKTVKEDHHLLWLGKQTATVAWDVVRCLVDVVNLPATMVMKGVMKLSGHTPTAAGPWRTISERSLIRQTGELLADVGAVAWDGMLFMKCSVVTTAKLVGYLGNGVETLLHSFSDRKSTEATVTSAPSDRQKSSSSHQDASHLVHDMSSTQKGRAGVTSAPGETSMGQSIDKNSNPLQLLRAAAGA